MSLNPEIHFILESFEKNQSLKKKKCKRAHIDILHSECLLDNLFPFKSETDFLQNNFKLNPVVSRGDNDCGNILKELLFDLDISELIKNSASERIHVVSLIQKNVLSLYTPYVTALQLFYIKKNAINSADIFNY